MFRDEVQKGLFGTIWGLGAKLGKNGDLQHKTRDFSDNSIFTVLRFQIYKKVQN